MIYTYQNEVIVTRGAKEDTGSGHYLSALIMWFFSFRQWKQNIYLGHKKEGGGRSKYSDPSKSKKEA
jgi:hypothetical protein